jgi:hypothetical protein
LLCKTNTVAKSKEVKAGWSNSEKSGRIFQGRLWLKKKCCFATDDDDDESRLKYNFNSALITNQYVISLWSHTHVIDGDFLVSIRHGGRSSLSPCAGI